MTTPHPQNPWNHSIHYHPLLLRAMPTPTRNALDVGCGEGLLARQLATRAQQVTAIDADPAIIERARALTAPTPNLTFLTADLLHSPLPHAPFDFITCVATLHHLPLPPALRRLRSLLAPGGTLALLGLYRPTSLADHLTAAAALPVSRLLRLVHPPETMNARILPPTQTLPQIRAAAASILSGARLTRRLLFRYTLLWRRPTP